MKRQFIPPSLNRTKLLDSCHGPDLVCVFINNLVIYLFTFISHSPVKSISKFHIQSYPKIRLVTLRYVLKSIISLY